ncbi:MAG: hypothetical protein AABY22_16495, partial [Nanoarchaeota archaeon]
MKGDYTKQKNEDLPVEIKDAAPVKVRIVEERVDASQIFPHSQSIVQIKEAFRPLITVEDARNMIKTYNDLIGLLIEENDIVVIEDKKTKAKKNVIKKSGFNKVAKFFGITVEILRA